MIRQVRNLSRTDRTIRAVVGLALFAVTLNSSEIMTWNIVATFVAIYLLLTTFVAWDPLYSLFGFATLPKSEARLEEDIGYFRHRRRLEDHHREVQSRSR